MLQCKAKVRGERMEGSSLKVIDKYCSRQSIVWGSKYGIEEKLCFDA
jgi:hypothetical protein